MNELDVPILLYLLQYFIFNQMSKVAYGCSRGVLVLLNVALLIASLVLIGLVLWIRFDNNFEAEIRKDLKIHENIAPLDSYKELINTGLTVSFWVLLVFGIAGAVIGLIGAVGAVFGLKCIIGFHFVLLLIMALLEIAIGIYILVTRDTLRQTVQGYVIAAYNAKTLDYDSIRMRYDCCGIDGTPDLACLTGQPTCTGAVWDRLDFSLMVAGFVLMGILICQFVSCLCSVTALCIKRNE
ncbi:hypothetical protein PENTCL1PPCAC_9768 [Pristionchus entomophagus]|uniref:Tetraspanin n=1 Tax=Pristionchus entomophagus TaxID=358040 RepID=A0AAV5T028_9BILA|nr:hypothetical protein PENTCL1PPCAC_9768 [Pristionchus entomophagus]